MLPTGMSYSSTAVMTAPPTLALVLDLPSESFFSLLVDSTSRSRTEAVVRKQLRMITHHARWFMVTSSHCSVHRCTANELVSDLERWIKCAW